jgi:hypothetical protein
LEKQFKKITVCAAVGSGHPYISQSDIQTNIEQTQIQSNNKIVPNVKDITKELSKWTKLDDENILRGPEIKVAMTTAEGDTTSHAIAYQDTFDKKKAQKMFCFPHSQQYFPRIKVVMSTFWR